MILKVNDRVRVRTVDFFDGFKLTLSHDTIASVFSFDFFFDPKNRQHAELACLSHFHEAIVEHNGERLLTGYIVGNTFNSKSTREPAQLGGYSKAGVLEDCKIPPKYFPLETVGLSLKQIIEKYIEPFDLSLEVDTDVTEDAELAFISNGESDDSEVDSVVINKPIDDRLNRSIDRANASISQSYLSFFTELAVQRNILLSHNSFGNVLITKPKATGKPIAHFENGTVGVTVTLTFNGQGLHSEIWGVKQADSEGGNAAEDFIKNPFVPIVYRPTTVVMTSGTDISMQEFLQKELAKELKENIKLVITTSTWVIDGKIIRPNNIITARNDDVFLYKKTSWFIETVEFTGNAKETTAVITCVLPEVYNGKTPTNIFVDVHNNFPRQ